MHLDTVEYKGSVVCGEKVFCYRRGQKEDIKALADLYRGCAIHRGNYKEKLKKESETSFEKTGGMYLILGEEEIQREIHDPGSLWAVMQKDGEIVGSFWISEENPLLEGVQIREYVFGEGLLVYPREIIVSPLHFGEMLGQFLFATVFRALKKKGFQYSLCDVYRTVAYAEGEIWHETDLLNKPSYSNMLALGGSYQGAGAVREITLEGLRVMIEPQVFLFTHKKSLKLTGCKFAQKGIQIYEEN